MSEHLTDPTSTKPVFKLITLTVAVGGAVLVLFTTYLARLPRLDSSAGISSPSSPAAALRLKSPRSASRASKLCFTRDDWIYLKDLKTGTETKLVEGAWPELSPDGNSIIFMSGGDTDATTKGRMRVLDLSSLQVREFNSLADRGILIASWSHDGTRIAVEMVDSAASRLDIGVFDPATGELKNLTNKLELGSFEGGIDFDSWVPGDQSVLFHSSENLFEVTVDGTLGSKLPIAQLEISSRTKFSLSADRKYLLFDTIVDTPERPLNFVVMTLDLATKKLATVTPHTVDATDPRWFPQDKTVLFSCLKRPAHPPYRRGICSIGVDGKDLKVLAQDAQDASFSVE